MRRTQTTRPSRIPEIACVTVSLLALIIVWHQLNARPTSAIVPAAATARTCQPSAEPGWSPSARHTWSPSARPSWSPTAPASPTTAPGATAPATADAEPSWSPGAHDTLVFSSTFNTLNTRQWATSWFGGGSMNNVSTPASNVSVSGGDLVLTLSSPGTGALVNTDPSQVSGGGFQFGDGYSVEARIFFPGSGNTWYNWPGFWADGQDWPSDGEIDIAEGLGNATSNYHSSAGADNSGILPGSWGGGWHTYGVDREAGKNLIYWDGKLVRSYATNDGGAPEYLIFNVGSSGNAVTGATGAMKVQWVRAWKNAA